MGNIFKTSHRRTRRQFLKAAGAGLAVPYLVPSSVFGVAAPSESINVALIGAGNQSRVDLPSILISNGSPR
jgi:hypothetical protein